MADALEQERAAWEKDCHFYKHHYKEALAEVEHLRAAIREEADGLADQLTGITGAVDDLRDGTLTAESLERLHRDCSEYVDALRALTKPEKCSHGKGLTDYCEPCGRIHGEGE